MADRDEAAVVEAMDWLRQVVRLGEPARPASNEDAAAWYARELLHELERLAAVELLAETPPDEVERLRAIEARAREVHGSTTYGPDAWAAVAHYILTGETR